jgi:hypothetical protein
VLGSWDWRNAVDFLNDNAAGTQAILAFVLVGVTSWYAWLTRRAVRAAEQSRRPYIYLDFEFDGPRLAIVVVGNAGDRAAENIKFEVEQDVQLEKGETLSAKVPPLSQGLQYLAPQRRYLYMFISPFDFSKGREEAQFRAKVSYQFGRDRYSETIKFGFSAFEGVLFRSFREPGTEVASELGHLRQAYERVHRESPFQPRTTVCPKCRELVKVGALKCPHCLTWIKRPYISRLKLRPYLQRVTSRFRGSAEEESQESNPAEREGSP